MIDLHSHILPGVDDGSRDVAESLQLLEMLREQGMTAVAATPHFYANDESVDEFLARRQTAYEALKAELPDDAPEIFLGAEVRYYEGISRMPDLKKLRIQGSRILLVEMSMSRWTEYTVKELVDLARLGGTTVVLAHIERFLPFQSSEVWKRLLDSGVLMQVNATFFTEFATRRKALSLLKKQSIHFLGSDCHGVKVRYPEIGKAVEIIEKKMGGYFIEQMADFADRMFAR